MDGQNRAERQTVCMHKNGHQRRRPIVQMQNLQLRCQSPGQLDDCFGEKNESRGFLLVRLPPLAVNSCAIKKFIATDEEQLHAVYAAAFQVPRNMSRVADLDVDGYTGVLFLKRAILSNLTVERKRDADLVPAITQRGWQRVHDIYERARPLHRGPLCAAHQNSHSAFAILILLARQISFFDPLKRFIGVAQASLQLSRLNCLEDLAKFRARLKTERDQIITAQQRRRNDWFVSEFFALAQQKFVIVQHAMTAFAINPVQLQFL